MTQRTDQKLAKEFKKDATFEQVLSSLNECLYKEGKSLLQDKGHLFPTLHILGAPRSGTTLVSQILASHLSIGYINNLIAAFWKAPIYGIELSKRLLGVEYKSNFDSSFGRTNGILEPHEFGYFWNYHLNYSGLQQLGGSHESTINWEQLASTLNNMTYHFNAPVAFKSFLFGFHAAAAVEYLPKTCFIYIKRDFLDNAFSILKLRKQLNGNVEAWGSIKPIQYDSLKSLSVHEQIAGQILCMEHEYLSQLEQVPVGNRMHFQYEDVCENPANFLSKIKDLLGPHCKKVIQQKDIEVDSFQVRKTNLTNQPDTELFLEAKSKIEQLFPDLKTWTPN